MSDEDTTATRSHDTNANNEVIDENPASDLDLQIEAQIEHDIIEQQQQQQNQESQNNQAVMMTL